MPCGFGQCSFLLDADGGGLPIALHVAARLDTNAIVVSQAWRAVMPVIAARGFRSDRMNAVTPIVVARLAGARRVTRRFARVAARLALRLLR